MISPSIEGKFFFKLGYTPTLDRLLCSIFVELSDSYKAMDPADNASKRSLLAEHLKESIDVLEQKVRFATSFHRTLCEASYARPIKLSGCTTCYIIATKAIRCRLSVTAVCRGVGRPLQCNFRSFYFRSDPRFFCIVAGDSHTLVLGFLEEVGGERMWRQNPFRRTGQLQLAARRAGRGLVPPQTLGVVVWESGQDAAPSHRLWSGIDRSGGMDPIRRLSTKV